MPSTQTDEWYREQAYEQFNDDGTIEVDQTTAIVSRHEDDCKCECRGAYVQAWVWVYDPPLPEDDE